MSIESRRIENQEIKDKSLIVSFHELIEKEEHSITIAHLNINFLQHKFEPLVNLIQEKIDILIISETKIDESFSSNQFMIDGYSIPFREDRNSQGGGLLIYVREDIRCKRLKTNNTSGDIEGIFIEVNIRNSKWFLMGGYNPNNDSISYFLSRVSKVMDMYLKDCENIILLGDFNSPITNHTMSEFLPNVQPSQPD